MIDLYKTANPGGDFPMNNTFQLIIEDDQGQQSVVPVEVGEVTIGRAEESTICLDERNVSRSHTRIKEDDQGQIIALDLDSYNGTWVNGERLEGLHLIREGDLIRVGDFQIELRGEGLPKAADATAAQEGSDLTQPGVRISMIEEGDSAQQTEPEAPVEAPRAEPVEELEDKVEKTAIIRLSDYEDVMGAAPGEQPAAAVEGARLIGVSAHFAGQEFEVGAEEVVLGRTDDNDITLEHRSVSRHHAKITFRAGRYTVVDLTSANGTLVNGEEYAQIELKSGDLLELGHVKFRFVPGGQAYAFSADELEIIEATTDTVPLTGALPSASHSGQPGARSLPLWVAGAGLAVLAVLGLMVFGGEGEQGASSPGGTVVQESDVGADSAVSRLLKRARGAMEERRWGQAEALYNAVLELAPDNEEARLMVGKAQFEQGMKETFEKAQGFIGAGDWSSAWNTLGDIPGESVYSQKAAALSEEVRGGLFSERIAEAREAISARAWERASSVLDELQGLDSSRAEIGQLRKKIEQGKAGEVRRPSSPPPPKPKATSRPRSAPRAAPEKPAVSAQPTPRPAPRAKPKPAPAPAPELSELPRPAASAQDPKALYKAGVKALRQGAYQRSIEQFSKCIKADLNYSRCYRAMGIVYAKMDNAPKAARYYRLYLKINPEAKDAEQVRKLLESYEAQ
jgi:pSer/pThr/pTyr-binding forkhead associated (FHA) protein/tetratricopeptide (TPR) repeat protein